VQNEGIELPFVTTFIEIFPFITYIEIWQSLIMKA